MEQKTFEAGQVQGFQELFCLIRRKETKHG